MKVKSLQLVNYRNYHELNLEPSSGVNIFIGQNAQGKTNVIEAIYYASTGIAYRTNTENDLIMWGNNDGFIKINFERLGVDNKLEFIFSIGNRRQIIYNAQRATTKNIIGAINMVLFCPEDLMLIKGSPAVRRKFLDVEISQASPSYYHELVKFNRLLRQRNSLLKKIRDNNADNSMLDIWNPQLASSGAKIVQKRLEAVKKFNMLANLMQRRISSNEENLSLSYQIKGMEDEKVDNSFEIWYNEMLSKSTKADMSHGSTGIGPHRDDIIISVNGINMRSFGSQGQQRTGVLAMKLSELEFLRSETGEYPVLLLDDVMSELDADRRRQLVNFIKRENIQTFITATDRAYFPDMEDVGRYYTVQAGNISV